MKQTKSVSDVMGSSPHHVVAPAFETAFRTASAHASEG